LVQQMNVNFKGREGESEVPAKDCLSAIGVEKDREVKEKDERR
jgi:hypothetical protein